jgi:predicted GIY-YIG superfamily endonuclease
MPDYSKCVIYTIRTGEGLYVGSSCNYNQRKWKHKSNINNEKNKAYNLKLYTTIRENGGAWDMQPHSEYQCNSKMEMNIEEERVRKELKADLNMVSCYSGLSNQLTKPEYKKEYDIKNKDKISAYQKEYRLKKKEKANQVI